MKQLGAPVPDADVGGRDDPARDGVQEVQLSGKLGPDLRRVGEHEDTLRPGRGAAAIEVEV